MPGKKTHRQVNPSGACTSAGNVQRVTQRKRTDQLRTCGGCVFAVCCLMLHLSGCAATNGMPTHAADANDITGISATFSIVAVDPDTGEVGAAVASKFPAVGRAVPYVRAGVGAFITQHYHNPAWGEKALDLMAEGKTPEEVLATLLKDDPRPGKRQLAIITTGGRAVQRHCDDADPNGRWWGGVSGRFYACQGNTLTGPEVVVAMGKAYETTKGSLADRMMAALIAGDCAGGDHRGRLAAGLKVAKKGTEGVWFELHVDKSDDAVIELARKYVQTTHDAKGDWHGGKPPFKHPCPDRIAPKAP